LPSNFALAILIPFVHAAGELWMQHSFFTSSIPVVSDYR
jgi:hypothetical protein